MPRRYSGACRVWSLVEMLAQCIDPTDMRLYAVSQLTHVLQILEAMESEHADTEEFVLAALVHDLGKVLLLTDEAPENIVCMNTPIGSPAPGSGFANCVFQWNHDEFAWSRLKDFLPEGVAWLVRYHSVLPEHCAHLMDDRDRELAQRYLRPFARYDHGTKSPLFVPRRRIEHYRPVVERWLPETIGVVTSKLPPVAHRASPLTGARRGRRRLLRVAQRAAPAGRARDAASRGGRRSTAPR